MSTKKDSLSLQKAKCREKYNNSEEWRAFAVGITHNDFIRIELFNKQKGKCAKCTWTGFHGFKDISGKKAHIHHIEYDHLCSFGKYLPDRTKDLEFSDAPIPDCKTCSKKNEKGFKECLNNKLQLLHAGCHKNIHKGKIPTSPDQALIEPTPPQNDTANHRSTKRRNSSKTGMKENPMRFFKKPSSPSPSLKNETHKNPMSFFKKKS